MISALSPELERLAIAHVRNGNEEGLQQICEMLGNGLTPEALRVSVRLMDGGTQPVLTDDGEVLLIVRKASSIQTKKLAWLWVNRFVAGAINLLIGMPDVGKSVLICELAGRITDAKASWPPVCGEPSPAPHGHVVFLAAEDSPETTLVHRLKAAGADLDRVHFVEGVHRLSEDGHKMRDAFDIARDVRHLESLRLRIEADGGKLIAVFIDPLDSYMNAKVDTNIGNKVRAALWPLKDWCEQSGITIIIVHHFNKSATTVAIDKVSGARSFGALPRSVWAVGRDPHDDTRTILAPIKLNLIRHEDKKAVAYRVQPSLGNPAVPCVAWFDEAVDVTASDIVAGKASKRDEAEGWLRDMLADGPMDSNELKGHAEQSGPSWRTVRRAADAIGVDIEQRREGGKIAGWTWRLKR